MPESKPARSFVSDASGHILTALRNVQLRPAAFLTAAGGSACGLPVGVKPSGLAPHQIETALAECQRSLAQSVPVNLSIAPSGAGDRFRDDLQRLGGAILGTIGEQFLSSGLFGITLHAGARPLAACRLISRLLPPQVPLDWALKLP